MALESSTTANNNNNNKIKNKQTKKQRNFDLGLFDFPVDGSRYPSVWLLKLTVVFVGVILSCHSK